MVIDKVNIMKLHIRGIKTPIKENRATISIIINKDNMRTNIINIKGITNIKEGHRFKIETIKSVVVIIMKEKSTVDLEKETNNKFSSLIKKSNHKR